MTKLRFGVACCMYAVFAAAPVPAQVIAPCDTYRAPAELSVTPAI